MNKKLHFLLFCLAVVVIIYLSKDKLLDNFGNLEPFGNQIIIHPDTAELNPRETTFSVLTYDNDLGSRVTQVSTCSDDSSWRNGDKTCRDYSLDGTNCEDIGSDGKSAFDACKVACDNCNTYTEVKRRLPSPMEDTDEPSYAQFEGSMSSGDIGSDIGGPDYREIIGKLDDLSGKIDLIEVSSGSTDDGDDTVDATCVETATTSVPADRAACEAVTDLSDATACEAVMTAGNHEIAACTYNPAITRGGSIRRDSSGSGCETQPQQQYSTCAEPGINCGDRVLMNSPERAYFMSGIQDEEKKNICCRDSTAPEQPASPTTTTTPPPATCTDSICTAAGYSIKDPIPTLKPGTVANTENCCLKTGFCKVNNDGKNNVTCWSLFSTDKVPPKDKGKPTPLLGQGTHDCCEYKFWRRVGLLLFFIMFFIYKTLGDGKNADIVDHIKWRIMGIGILSLWIFTNIIPNTIYYLRKSLDVEKEKSDIGPWPETVFYLLLGVGSLYFLYKYNEKFHI